MIDQTPDAIREVHFLPDKVNSEPNVFRGLTSPEMFKLVKIGIFVWIPLCLGFFFLLGMTMIGLGAGALLTMGTVIVGGHVMQRLKRGKPDNYHLKALTIIIQDRRLGKAVFNRDSGPWSPFRSVRPN